MKGSFSYYRLQGLQHLLEILLRFSKEELACFQSLQNSTDKNLTRMLLNHILAPLSPPKSSVISDAEIQVALDVLQGTLLMHSGSKKVLRQYHGIEALLDYVMYPNAEVQIAALDALLTAMLDSCGNQEEFEDNGGFGLVASIMKDVGTDKDVRAKCAETLCLLIGYMDETATDEGVADYEDSERVDANRTALVEVAGEDLCTQLVEQVRFGTEKSTAAAFIAKLDSK